MSGGGSSSTNERAGKFRHEEILANIVRYPFRVFMDTAFLYTDARFDPKILDFWSSVPPNNIGREPDEAGVSSGFISHS